MMVHAISGLLKSFQTNQIAKSGQKDFSVLIILPIVWITLYSDLIVPKTTITVHDRVLNRQQAIGGVPIGIAYVACILNTVENMIIDIIGTANQYDRSAGGLYFSV